MLISSLQFPFGSKKVHFRPESGQDQHRQPKTHDLKFEENVKDGGQFDSHLIIDLAKDQISNNKLVFF